jgi:hypothetical protein
MNYTADNKISFKTKTSNRIYAKKIYVVYKNILSFDYDAYSAEQHNYESLYIKFNKKNNVNMRCLILKSPKKNAAIYSYISNLIFEKAYLMVRR